MRTVEASSIILLFRQFCSPTPMYHASDDAMEAPLIAPTFSAARRPPYVAGCFAKTSPLPHASPQRLSLDKTSFANLTAFQAGPRRDPASRMLHVQALAASGRTSYAVTPQARNTGFIGSSWGMDVEDHARIQGLLPAFGTDGLCTSGAAGISHPNLGVFGPVSGPPQATSQHFGRLAASLTEEKRRLLLLTGEQARRHADKRWAPTDTLGLGASWR